MHNYQKTNLAAYNQARKTYHQDRQQFRTEKYLREFMKLLPEQADVLDVGCGSGVPTATLLTKAGHWVTGIDISPSQVQLARQNCPGGNFLVHSIEALTPKQYQVDGIVCLYALFHTPRETHLKALQIFASFLPAGAPLLITMGDVDFEGEHPFYQTKAWSSHYGTEKNRELLQQAGFTIQTETIDTSGGERHQIILAIKE